MCSNSKYLIEKNKTDKEANMKKKIEISKKTKFKNSKEQLKYYLGHQPDYEYPFLLDEFQVRAILLLDNKDHLLVTAHTSSGKTVIAEYAIAKALKNKTRVIYTSPIKALSNQKFREFQSKFFDVGLMTGDIYKNPTASILVMTTEILRNMLYRRNKMLTEVAFVVFDEVHYMRDVSRGVVWEESIILMNNNIQMIFLSATLSNASDFANWVEFVKDHPCPIVSTKSRPIPLKHYVYPKNGEGIFLIKDVEGKFLINNFLFAQNLKRDRITSLKQKRKRLCQYDIVRLLLFLKEQNGLPCVVFTFSRLNVEGLALLVWKSKICFVNKEEQKMIKKIFNNATNTLLEVDRELDSIKSMKTMLITGIGCHHSGLIPIIKEITELLFQEGLLKILFATETFAMGINMPAKTVIFAHLQKWDGTTERFLTSEEYTQMSGRAGRRGHDKYGTSIIVIDSSFNSTQCVKMTSLGTPPLSSSFRLTYNMLLNLKKADIQQIRQVINSSFYLFLIENQTLMVGKKKKKS